MNVQWHFTFDCYHSDRFLSLHFRNKYSNSERWVLRHNVCGCATIPMMKFSRYQTKGQPSSKCRNTYGVISSTAKTATVQNASDTFPLDNRTQFIFADIFCLLKIIINSVFFSRAKITFRTFRLRDTTVTADQTSNDFLF